MPMPCDYSKYPPNWKSEIRPRILQRANNCCEFCVVENYAEGIRSLEKLESLDLYMTDHATMPEKALVRKWGENYNELKHIKIVLTIAHLDHDEENHEVEDERLAALCQQCHLRYDAQEKVKRRKVKKYNNSLFPLNSPLLSKKDSFP